MHEQARALDVGEELVAEPRPLAGAFDQAGDVGEDQLALFALEHAEHGRERGEGIVGDLRSRACEAREQRGLAGVRQPDESHVGEQLQLQLEPPLLPGQAPLGEAGRLPRGRCEALVALPAGAPARDRGPLARHEQLPAAALQIALIGTDDLRARRHGDLERLAVGAVAQRALSVPAPAGVEVRPAAECLKVAQRVIADEHDRSSVPAVAAIGASARHVRLAAKALAAVPAGARLNMDSRAVVKHPSIVTARASAGG